MTASRSAARQALDRVVRNFAMLLGGRAIGAVLALSSTLIAARVLGPAGFGLVALLHAYVLTVRGLINLKPFEAIVRYGVPLIEDRDHAALARLLRAGLVIDVLSAVTGTLVALAGVRLMTAFDVWTAATEHTAMAYCLLLLTAGQGTASGILRSFDRFYLLSAALLLGNGLRLAGVLALTLSGTATPTTVAAVWAVSQAGQYLAEQVFGWREARARIPAPQWRAPIDLPALRARHPGIGHFLHVIYWQSSLDLVPKALGTLLAGALLGNEGAALFRIAREFANVVSKPALLVRQAIFPDLARMLHRGEGAFAEVIVSVVSLLALPATAVILVAWWFGKALLGLTLGADYVPAATLLTWLVAAAGMELAAAPLRPAAYTLGHAGTALAAQGAGAVIYVCAFVALAPRIGASAPGVAHLVLNTLMLGALALIVRRALSSR